MCVMGGGRNSKSCSNSHCHNCHFNPRLHGERPALWGADARFWGGSCLHCCRLRSSLLQSHWCLHGVWCALGHHDFEEERDKFKVLNYSCRVSPWPRETHRNVLRTIHLNASRLLCILAHPLPAPQSEWGGKTGLSPNFVPASPSWACPQRAESSALSHEGLENSMHVPPFSKGRGARHKPTSFLPHATQEEMLVSQENPDHFAQRPFQFRKAVGSAVTCQRVCLWALPTWKVHSFLPPRKLDEGDLKCLKYQLRAQAPSGNNELVEAEVLMHRINTGPRCWHVTSSSPSVLEWPTCRFRQQGRCSLRGWGLLCQLVHCLWSWVRSRQDSKKDVVFLFCYVSAGFFNF